MGIVFDDFSDIGSIESGQTIEKNGKKYKIILEETPVEYGPLGSELLPLEELIGGDRIVLIGEIQTGYCLDRKEVAVRFKGVPGYVGVPKEALAERIISGQVPGAPLSAKEASKIADIVGRFVALEVIAVDQKNSSIPLAIGTGQSPENKHKGVWLESRSEVILLPKNFGKQFE